MNSVIQIEKLTKYYGKHKGIENVTFSVNEGEICGFIGPNGAGKSTTIRTLLALIHPTAGNARIFGLNAIEKASEIAKNVGYLSSESSYYNDMTVADLLRYSQELYNVDCVLRTSELVQSLQLDTSRKIRQLSLGNRKKVGIVQALMHRPKLLILDEPTSGLDPLMQQVLFEILRIEQANGVTILFSSHVLGEVQKICDRVVIIKEGTIIKEHRIDELNQNGYKKIFLSTKKIIPDDYFKDTGIANLSQDENHATFMFKGNIADIVKKIYSLNITDLNITEPDLEEIFLHYYE